MYNLAALSDFEFEKLSKDIMEKVLNMKLSRFSRGRDGGIDLCDSKGEKLVIAQVKHYANSKFSDLKKSLANEVMRISEKNPLDYYVITSLGLSKSNKETLVNMFPRHLKDITHVIDKITIDDFLNNKENIDIVEKNYKLWLTGSEVMNLISNQNIFVDCCELMDDISNQAKYFVETSSFFDCLNILEKSNIAIITGNPGVGKSITSKMIVLKYASDGYRVRYSSGNNLSELKKSLSLEPSIKEIVLLDDFLGQHYLKLSDQEPNELKSLISFIVRSPNKKLIMNSRITIYNEAKSISLVFNDIVEKQEKNNYLIDLDKMSGIEKSKILYNYLYFNVPAEYIKSIDYNGFKKIVNHENYNPRIIEFVTKKRNFENIVASKYINFVYEKLENPDNIWHDEFIKIDDVDRIFMYTLYSLTDLEIDEEILENAFISRIKSYDKFRVKFNQNIFSKVKNRLTESLIKIVIKNDKTFISVLNPSINDYIKYQLYNNSAECDEICDKALYIEQIIKIDNTINKNKIYEILSNNTLLNLESYLEPIGYYYIFYITKFDLDNEIFVGDIKEKFEECFGDITYSSINNLMNLIIKKKLLKKLGLAELFIDPEFVDKLLKKISYETEKELLFYLYNIKDFDLDAVSDIFKSSIINKIDDYTYEEINDEAYQLISDPIDNVLNGIYDDYDEVKSILEENDVLAEAEEILLDEIRYIIENEINDIFDILNISSDDINEYDILSFIDLEDVIYEYVSDEYLEKGIARIYSAEEENDELKEIYDSLMNGLYEIEGE